jgi:hypothetical protein
VRQQAKAAGGDRRIHRDEIVGFVPEHAHGGLRVAREFQNGVVHGREQLLRPGHHFLVFADGKQAQPLLVRLLHQVQAGLFQECARHCRPRRRDYQVKRRPTVARVS